MKKSDIAVGEKYLFNPQGKNRYGAFDDDDYQKEIIEVEVVKVYGGGDLEVKVENCQQTIHWSELNEIKL